MSDEMPDLIAQIDQARRAVLDVAKLMRAYHEALTGEGFTEDQALAMTLDYQRFLLRGAA